MKKIKKISGLNKQVKKMAKNKDNDVINENLFDLFNKDGSMEVVENLSENKIIESRNNKRKKIAKNDSGSDNINNKIPKQAENEDCNIKCYNTRDRGPFHVIAVKEN